MQVSNVFSKEYFPLTAKIVPNREEHWAKIAAKVITLATIIIPTITVALDMIYDVLRGVAYVGRSLLNRIRKDAPISGALSVMRNFYNELCENGILFIRADALDRLGPNAQFTENTPMTVRGKKFVTRKIDHVDVKSVADWRSQTHGNLHLFERLLKVHTDTPEFLLATGNAYLDGSAFDKDYGRSNAYGIALMQVREKLQGTGVIERPMLENEAGEKIRQMDMQFPSEIADLPFGSRPVQPESLETVDEDDSGSAFAAGTV